LRDRFPLRFDEDVRLVVGMKVLFFIRDLAVGGSQRQLSLRSRDCGGFF